MPRQTITYEMDDAAQAGVQQLLELRDQLVSASSTRWSPDPGSSLFRDDEKTSPYQVSHRVQAATNAACDHLAAYVAMLIPSDDLSAGIITRPNAAASLLRGVYEGTAVALWLLSGATREERVCRRLELALDEARLLDALYDEIRTSTASPAAVPPADRRSSLETDLVSRGLLTAEQARRMQRYRLQRTRILADVARIPEGQPTVRQLPTMWRATSSLAHGDQPGMLSLLNQEVVAETADGSVVTVHLTASVETLIAHGLFSASMLRMAYQRIETRARPPY